MKENHLSIYYIYYSVKRQSSLSVSYLQALKNNSPGCLSSGLFGIRQFATQNNSSRIYSVLSSGALILELHALYPEQRRHKYI